MRVLITGATGYLGRAVVASCHAAGHRTVAFSRRATTAALAGEAFDGDVRDGRALLAAMDGCEAVCHVAALVSVWRRRPGEFDEVNVGGLARVLESAARLRIKRVVYTSSFLALPPGGDQSPRGWNDYQRTKVEADRIAGDHADQGSPLIRMYPGVIYGPGVLSEGNLVGRSIADHLQGRLPGVIGADRIWSFSWVDDVARAHVSALERGTPGSRYFLGGEQAPQMRVYELVRELTGCPLPRRLPGWAAVGAGAASEAWAALTGRPPLLTVGTVEVLLRDWPVPFEAAVREIGYHVTPLREGVARIVAELQRAGFPPRGGAR